MRQKSKWFKEDQAYNDDKKWNEAKILKDK